MSIYRHNLYHCQLLQFKQLFRFIHYLSVLRKNYYEVLGVKQNASLSEIKAAYFQKSKKLHPDSSQYTNESSTTQRHEEFIELTNAYETLKHPDSRAGYDQLLHYAYNRCQMTSDSSYSNNTYRNYWNSEKQRVHYSHSNYDHFQSHRGILIENIYLVLFFLGISFFVSQVTIRLLLIRRYRMKYSAFAESHQLPLQNNFSTKVRLGGPRSPLEIKSGTTLDINELSQYSKKLRHTDQKQWLKSTDVTAK